MKSIVRDSDSPMGMDKAKRNGSPDIPLDHRNVVKEHPDDKEEAGFKVHIGRVVRVPFLFQKFFDTTRNKRFNMSNTSSGLDKTRNPSCRKVCNRPLPQFHILGEAPQRREDDNS